MKEFKKIIVIAGLFSFALISCEKWFWQPDELHLQKETYSGDELKMNGFFIQRDTITNYLSVYFFYRNGVIMYAETFPENELHEKENSFLTKEWINTVKDTRFCWGVFNIADNNIKYEKWYPYEFGDPTYIREGEILNDSTFIITESYRLKSGEKKEWTKRNEIYHFKQFSPKPDSTNNFVK